MGAVTGQIAADPEDRQRRSVQLAGRLAEVIERWSTDHPVSHVMAYRSLASEPDLSPFANWCAGRWFRLYHPEVAGSSLRVVPGDADPSILDVVVVPGRAFTAAGHRLGRGGGHYDRFLARLRPDCLTVAAAYREQVVAELPTEAHDVPVAVVVTDE